MHGITEDISSSEPKKTEAKVYSMFRNTLDDEIRGINLYHSITIDDRLYIFLGVVEEQNIRKNDEKTLRWTLPIL